MIKCKEDLVNTYIDSDSHGLRQAYKSALIEFGYDKDLVRSVFSLSSVSIGATESRVWHNLCNDFKGGCRELTLADFSVGKYQDSVVHRAKTATELLESGKSIIAQRGEEYETDGKEERGFGNVATAFNAITGKEVTAAEVALMLQILKDVRQFSQNRLHEDSVIDGINYAALKGEELYKQYS